MKKIIYLLLFIPVIGFSQTYPYQIEPDTSSRMIMMTDTSVIDSPALEFVYYSIDSLVKQITIDSLGLDGGYWGRYDTISTFQKSNENNIFLGKEVGNKTLTGLYNFISGNTAAQSITSGSYNTISGYNLAGSLTSNNGNTVFGSNIAPLATSLQYSTLSGGNLASVVTDLRFSFIAGYDNLKNATGLNQYNFINGNGLANGGNLQYSFVNGYDQLSTTGTATFVFANGFLNFEGTGDVYASSASGRDNFKSNTGQILYSTGFGRENFALSTSASYSTGYGYQNLYSAASPFASTAFGEGNLRLATDSDYSVALGYRNLYNSTAANHYVIALGRENGNVNTDHSNSILLGYRQNYTSGGTNRLAIGMIQDDPLISGHFTSDWVRINGYLEVRDKSGTAGNITAWSGDKLVDSGISLSSLTAINPQWTNISGLLYSDYDPGNPLVLKPIKTDQIEFNLATATVTNTLLARNSSGRIAGVTVGSGLSFSSGTLSATGTSLWTDAGTYYRVNNLTDGPNSTFRIYDTGDVGIGTTGTPSYKLHVLGDGYFTDGVVSNGDIRFTNSSDIVFFNGGSGNITDSNGQIGTAGKILSHDGGGVAWTTPTVDLTPDIGEFYNTSNQVISGLSNQNLTWSTTATDDGSLTRGASSISVGTTGYYLVTVSGTVQMDSSCDNTEEVQIAITGSPASNTVTGSTVTKKSAFSLTGILYKTSGTTIAAYANMNVSSGCSASIQDHSIVITYLKS